MTRQKREKERLLLEKLMNSEGKKVRRGKGQCTFDKKEQCSSFNRQSSFTVRVKEERGLSL
jgi:hypothetical protein